MGPDGPDPRIAEARTLRLAALWTLHLYGPGHNADLARRAGMRPAHFHSAVFRLRRDGLARKGPEGYGLTDAGRQVLGVSGRFPAEGPSSTQSSFGWAEDP